MSTLSPDINQACAAKDVAYFTHAELWELIKRIPADLTVAVHVLGNESTASYAPHNLNIYMTKEWKLSKCTGAADANHLLRKYIRIMNPDSSLKGHRRYNEMHKVAFEVPLEEIPLYVNGEAKGLALWRLSIAK